MVIRILAVEDYDVDYENLKSLLQSMLQRDLPHLGVEEMQLVRAESAEHAEELLSGEEAQANPYHILILDLNIPERTGQLRTLTDYGFKVLNLARRLSTARQIIIYTHYPQHGDNIQTALREGANDFVQKPAQLGTPIDDELKTRFMCSWQRVLSDESARLLDERVKGLIPYAEAGLAHRFTAYFSDFVQTVAYTSHDVERYASERFGLEREKDSQDYLFRLLSKQEASLKAARENWAALNAALSPGDEKPKAEVLETLLQAVEEKLAPCLLVKNTRVVSNFYEGDQTRVLSFPDEVHVVIQEIISGTLSVLPDFGKTDAGKEHHIKVSLRHTDTQVEVQFADDIGGTPSQSILRTEAQAINGGFTIGPGKGEKRFGRAWGLSVMQHIALRGGGRLIVTPQPQGSQITYVIPRAQ
jgi:CheY-like chemotaxis protein